MNEIKTTVKEAIEQLNDLKRDREGFAKNDEPDSMFAYDIKAIDVAITVMEEKLERDKGCELCYKYDFTQIKICKGQNDQPTICFRGGYSTIPQEEQFNFCPKCGRRLVNEEEVLKDG